MLRPCGTLQVWQCIDLSVGGQQSGDHHHHNRTASPAASHAISGVQQLHGRFAFSGTGTDNCHLLGGKAMLAYVCWLYQLYSGKEAQASKVRAAGL